MRINKTLAPGIDLFGSVAARRPTERELRGFVCLDPLSTAS